MRLYINKKPKHSSQAGNMKTKQVMAMAALAIAMSLGASTVLAQNNDNNSKKGDNNNNNGGQGRKRGGGNFDPAQFQQQRLDRTKERLEITDDTEWNAIKPLVEKVMTAQAGVAADRMRGMFGGRNRGGGGDNASGDQGGQPRGGFGGFGTPSPEAEALRKAIEAKASNSELKAAVAKFIEARKTKQAEMEKAQADLRKVLSVRQEAIATETGLL
jgi:hypothetical protein